MKLSGLSAALAVVAMSLPAGAVSAADGAFDNPAMACATAHATMLKTMSPSSSRPTLLESSMGPAKTFAADMHAFSDRGSETAKVDAKCGRDLAPGAGARKLAQDFQDYAASLGAPKSF